MHVLWLFRVALLNIWLIHTTSAYRWTVLDADIANVCNHQTCGPRPHSNCLVRHHLVPFANCTAHGFRWLKIRRDDIRNIVDGHNGLRNRVALSHFNPRSNMNLVYWDKDLARMAEGWIGQCVIGEKDICDFMYNSSYSVGQNVMYFDRVPVDRWDIKIIRSWYLQGNTIDKSVLKNYHDVPQSGYTQLMWWNTQFIGCAAARIHRGYMMACNYYPKGNIVGQPVHYMGRSCSNCSDDRPSCSRVFHGLCGLDDGKAELRLDGRLLVLVMGLCYVKA